MKVTVSQQQLAHGLSLVSRAVSPRSTYPVLSNVLVATDEGRLRISATNLELGITCWIGTKITEDGSITVPSRTFADLVNTLPGEDITLAVDTKTQTMNVKCGASVTDIKGIDPQEFPPQPVYDLTNGVEFGISDLKDMIQQVAFAASTDDARPVLQGVLMKIGGSEVTLAATDGFRISVRTMELPQPVSREAYQLVVPARALSELARIAADGDEKITMVTPQGRGQVIFRMKDVELVSSLIDGKFPDFNAIIPQSFKTHTILSAASFAKACKQAEIIAREGSNVVRLNIMPGEDRPGKVEVSAQSEETGSSEVVVDATVDGPGLVIAFNVRFLREVLDMIKTNNVALETNANNTPGMLRMVGDDRFIHVIMPMHIG